MAKFSHKYRNPQNQVNILNNTDFRLPLLYKSWHLLDLIRSHIAFLLVTKKNNKTKQQQQKQQQQFYLQCSCIFKITNKYIASLEKPGRPNIVSKFSLFSTNAAFAMGVIIFLLLKLPGLQFWHLISVLLIPLLLSLYQHLNIEYLSLVLLGN